MFTIREVSDELERFHLAASPEVCAAITGLTRFPQDIAVPAIEAILRARHTETSAHEHISEQVYTRLSERVHPCYRIG